MATAENDAPLWERQPWDTTGSFAAFKEFYLPESDPGRLINAYRRYWQKSRENRLEKGAKKVRKITVHVDSEKKPPTAVPGSWGNWSRGCDGKGNPIPGAKSWAERAAAYDTYLHRLETEKLAEKRATNKAHRLRVLEGALAQVIMAWSQVSFRPTVGPDGRIAPADLPPFKDLVSALKVIPEQLRIEYGDTPKNVNLDVDLAKLTMRQIERLAAGEDILDVLINRDDQ